MKNPDTPTTIPVVGADYGAKQHVSSLYVCNQSQLLRSANLRIISNAENSFRIALRSIQSSSRIGDTHKPQAHPHRLVPLSHRIAKRVRYQSFPICSSMIEAYFRCVHQATQCGRCLYAVLVSILALPHSCSVWNRFLSHCKILPLPDIHASSDLRRRESS